MSEHHDWHDGTMLSSRYERQFRFISAGKSEWRHRPIGMRGKAHDDDGWVPGYGDD